VVTLSSGHTEEALELLFPSPNHDPISRILGPSVSSDSDQFEDWPEANDTVMSVYISLTADASSSRISMVSAPWGDRESRIDSSSTRQSHSRATSTRRPHRQKSAAIGAP
jgi:hypothetical protein